MSGYTVVPLDPPTVGVAVRSPAGLTEVAFRLAANVSSVVRCDAVVRGHGVVRVVRGVDPEHFAPDMGDVLLAFVRVAPSAGAITADDIETT